MVSFWRFLAKLAIAPIINPKLWKPITPFLAFQYPKDLMSDLKILTTIINGRMYTLIIYQELTESLILTTWVTNKYCWSIFSVNFGTLIAPLWSILPKQLYKNFFKSCNKNYCMSCVILIAIFFIQHRTS